MKIIFIKGIIASGKTTWAEQYIKENPNWVRVNKDTLRETFPNFTEKEIVNLETDLVRNYLKEGYNVIIDNTHFNDVHKIRYENLAKEFNAEFEIKEFEVDPITAIERDSKREKPVGKKAISEMYLKYIYKQPKGFNVTGNIILCDIDGTLAFKYEDRDIYDYTKVKYDYPNFILASILIQMYIAGNRIVFLSGREDGCRNETKEWIESFMCNIPGVDFHYTLLMRKAGDRRDDTVVKKEIFEANFTKDEILCVFDDRPKVRRMFMELGLYVFGCQQEPYQLEF